MRRGRELLAIACLMGIPAIAAADLVCPASETEPVAAASLDAEAIVGLMLPTFLKNGISILFLGALTVVGFPWTIAGLAIALVALPKARTSR